MSNAFEVLGSNENESIDVVKKKYRKLILQWHPDKAILNGVDPIVAKNKFTQIQEAWKLIESGRPWEFTHNYSDTSKTQVKSRDKVGPTVVQHMFGEGNFRGVFFEMFFGSNPGSQDLNGMDDFSNLMEFMDDKKMSPEEEKQDTEINQGFNELFDHINQVQEFIARETKTIDTKHILQNRYSPSIELILYVSWVDIDGKKTKSVTFNRQRRCQECSKNFCKVCKGDGIMNCKKCLQHGFFIKKNCDKCEGTGYIKEKKKIKVKLEHPDSPSFYIFPEDSDEKKGYDLPGDVYLKVIGD